MTWAVTIPRDKLYVRPALRFSSESVAEPRMRAVSPSPSRVDDGRGLVVGYIVCRHAPPHATKSGRRGLSYLISDATTGLIPVTG